MLGRNPGESGTAPPLLSREMWRAMACLGSTAAKASTSKDSLRDEAAGGGLGQAFGGPAEQEFDLNAELLLLVQNAAWRYPSTEVYPSWRNEAQTFLMASKEMGQGLISHSLHRRCQARTRVSIGRCGGPGEEVGVQLVQGPFAVGRMCRPKCGVKARTGVAPAHWKVCPFRRGRHWWGQEACRREDPGDVLGVHPLGRCFACSVRQRLK